MAQVIYIDAPKQEEKKKVEFTHSFTPKYGWEFDKNFYEYHYEKVIYIGKCNADGDMFAAYKDGIIDIWKGHLNSGEY